MRAERVYWRTQTGFKAWESPNSGLPSHYRHILGLIRSGTHVDAIRNDMQEYSDKEVLGWLDELDTLGFVETVQASVTSQDVTNRLRSWLDHLEAA